MLQFKRTEEGSEVSLRCATLSKVFSNASQLWKANMSPYNFIKYCTVLSHSCCWLNKFSKSTSSISVKCALAYIFSTNIITFSSSVHVTPIATHSAALCVSSRVYLLMWRLGVSDYGARRAALASIFSWFWILHHIVRRCVIISQIVLLE